MNPRGDLPGAVCIMGPTAAGKTAAAFALAEHHDIEIISVDSAMVYRGMDIGTAKPSAEERGRLPHRLVDIVDPDDVYSAGAFCRDAAQAIHEITAAGNLPVLVGGTMLYFQALQKGIAQLPGADPALREEIDARAAAEGWPALHAELARLDPETAACLKPMDSQRIQRALEVCLLAGEPLSALQASTAPVIKADWLNIGLLPADRQALHERIRARLETMVGGGFVDEVRRIAVLPGLNEQSPALRAVGYRQFLRYVNGEITEAEALEQAVVATRRLAKRQLTWLRSWPDLHVVDCLGEVCADEVGALVSRWLEDRASDGFSR